MLGFADSLLLPFAFVVLVLLLALRNAARRGHWRAAFLSGWLVVVIGTLPVALIPPYVHAPLRGLVSYEPWKGVLFVSVVVGVVMAVLYAIIRPATFDRSWGRLLGSIGFALAMSFLFFPLQFHMSGAFYVVGWFSVLSAFLLLVLGLVTVVQSLGDRWRSQHVPPSE